MLGRLTRRQLVGTAGASIGALSLGSSLTRGQDESNRGITLESPDNSRVDYDFEVESDLEKSDAAGASVNSSDTVSGNRASGYVTQGRDSYTFTGDLVRFAADGLLGVFLDGKRVDPSRLVSVHTLTLESVTGAELQYDFKVKDFDLQKSNALGASLDSSDAITENQQPGQRGRRAAGDVSVGRDSYTFTRTFDWFASDGDTNVFLDGRLVEPVDLVFTHILTIESVVDSRVSYSFTTSERGIQPSDALNASIEPEQDEGTGSSDRVDGHVDGHRDSYRMNGSLTDFRADGPVNLYLDGQHLY